MTANRSLWRLNLFWPRVLALSLLAGFAAASFAQHAAAPPSEIVPASLPAHDQHESVTVALTLCADEICSHQLFGKQNPVHSGILAVNVFLRNDSDQPLVPGLEDIRLDISGTGGVPDDSSNASANPNNGSDDDSSPRAENDSADSGRAQEISPLSPSGVAERILYSSGSSEPKAPGTPQIGFGLPHRQKNVGQLAAKIAPFTLSPEVINPHSAVHGYLFFDLNGNFGLIPRCSLYLPTIHTPGGTHYLTYFEVSLAPSYAAAGPSAR